MRKDRLDLLGLAVLIAVMGLFALNQIIIKEVNKGIQPVYFAGLRSALAVISVYAWLHYRGLTGRILRRDLGAGLAIGTVFAAEFLCLFMALDLTSVGRASVIFYSMPLWMAGLAHFGLADRLTPIRCAGLAFAFIGTAWAILSKSPTGHSNLLGDLFALGGAWGWAGTAFLARKTRLSEAGPEVQLFWMVLVSAPILLALSPLFGPPIRDVIPLHWFLLLVQAFIVVSGGFITWLWLLSVYPTSTVASFSFLSPIFAIALGYIFFAEPLSLGLGGAAFATAVGIVLINQKPSGAKSD